jgi:hypothetical protein
MTSALPPRMADNPETSEPFSLKRWSQRKRAAARAVAVDPIVPPVPDANVPAAAFVADPPPAPVAEAAPLPPVDSLTFDSDYSAFMQPKIAEEIKRAALRKLFSDPSFNVMDGLDIYVGDYTQADPMPAGMLEKVSAAYAMLDPVKPAESETAVGPTPESAIAIAPAAGAEDSGAAATDPRSAPPGVPDAKDATIPPHGTHIG